MADTRQPEPRGNPADTEEANAWLDQIRTQLDASARDLDAHTLSRLNRARQQALAQIPSRAPRRWHWLALASAASIALAVALLPTLRPPQPEALPVVDASVEDFELLTSEESLVLYSDMDFYAWLDTQDLGS
jgi:ferric-dicitrate binding protein FerR (iron transport regulator)